ncbi:unnamed protein product, partial [marine sediment metagenome]
NRNIVKLKLLSLVPSSTLIRYTCELQQSVAMDTVYL